MPRRRADDPQAAEATPEVMLATEVADYLRVSYITVLKMTHAGELNAIRVGREFRYLRSEIDNLMRQPARDPHPQLDQPADAEVSPR